MGYQVYKSRGRWQGYGVPAECDLEGCTVMIDRGLSYMCEDFFDYDESVGGDIIHRGCRFFFCGEHIWKHECGKVTGKPDSKEWLHHIATDAHWETWRVENPTDFQEVLRLLYQMPDIMEPTKGIL